MESSQKNVLCLHRRADGDSLGSNLAFASVLEKLGKEVTIYSIDEVPEYLRFLDTLHRRFTRDDLIKVVLRERVASTRSTPGVDGHPTDMGRRNTG